MPELEFLSQFTELGSVGLLIGLIATILYLNDRKDKRARERDERVYKEHKSEMHDVNAKLVLLNQKQLIEQQKSRETLNNIISIVNTLRDN